MKKIVDVVAVVKDKKSNEYKSARPIRNGKVERWWYEGGDTPHSINKRTANRNLSGREKLGKDLPTVEDTLKMFNFRGFEFGNWLSQSERYDVFRTFQYCLADMSDWLGSRNIGFDNQIGVAFGARGSRGAKAHYEAIENVINMTKMRGAGSLLHEYAHAIDYCVGAFFDQNGYHMGLSGGHTMSQSEKNVGGQFRAMMNKILNYARSTESYHKMSHTPQYAMNFNYWGNSTEMFARLTETYYGYYYNKNNNHYLVKPTSVYEKKSKDYGVYLSKAEMDVIKPELDKFWKEVGLLLNDKCKLKATPYPKDTTVKKKVKKTKLYFPVTDEYTDGTYREIKRKGGLPKPGTEAWQPLERWLEHYDSLEGKRRGLGIYKSYKIISRTKYSIRYRNNKGEYIESYIVGEDGKRLKEPAPKKKDKKQKPIQF